jgi:hypothetical protein
MSDEENVSEIEEISVGSDYEEEASTGPLSQTDMINSWASKIKDNNAIYTKIDSYYVRRAQSNGSIPDPEGGGLNQEYGVGDYLMIEPRDITAQFVVESAEFDQVFPGMEISEVDLSEVPADDLEKVKALVAEGYRKYFHKEKYWVFPLSVDDLGGATQFVSSDEEVTTMNVGDSLTLKWPTADEIGLASADELANAALWVDTAQQESPKVPPSPSMRRPAVTPEESERNGGSADTSAKDVPSMPPLPPDSPKEVAASPPPPPPPPDPQSSSEAPDWDKICNDFGIDDLEFKALKRRFDSYDADLSGTLEASELANLLAKMGQEYSDDEVALILKQIDQDSSGTVEFVEFLRWWTGNSDPPDAEMKIVDKNKQELAAQIFLFREQFENGSKTHFRFTLEVSQPKDVEFTLDCSGAENFESIRGDSLIFKATVSPYQKFVLGEIRQIDPNAGYSLGYGMSYRIMPTEMGPMNDALDKKVIDDAVKAEQSFEKDNGLIPSVDDLSKVKAAFQEKSVFVDLDFPPAIGSVCPPNKVDDTATSVVWKRACDFIKDDKPAIFECVEGGSPESAISPADIMQGGLGDCWFMCSLASVAEFPKMISALFVTDEYDTNGLHRVRFFKNGCWHEVTVDDFFPCFRDRGPVFSRVNGDELWVLFLEKAYAKLHGGYYALRGGFASEGLMDLTGCPADEFPFEDEEIAKQIEDGSLFDKILDWDQRGFLMCCSTPGEDKFSEKTRPGEAGGLVPGHAYTLLSAAKMNSGDRLLRIRNPWGSFEWDGDWSDADARWTDDAKAEIAAATGLAVSEVIVENDGTFWMPYEAFVTNFVKVAVCYLHPNNGGDWHQIYSKGVLCDSAVGEAAKFGAQSSAFFELTLKTRSEVIVCMAQEDTRCASAPAMVDIAFTVLNKADDEVVAYGWLGLERHITSAAGAKHQPLMLDAGTYVIVPWSSGCRIDPVAPGACKDAEKGALPAAARQLHSRFARRKDSATASRILDGADLADFFRAAGVDPGETEAALAVAGQLERGTLSEGGLLLWLEDLFDSSAGAAAVLEKLGYVWGKDSDGQPALVPQDQRAFVVTVCCDTENPQLEDVPYDASLHEKAVEQVIKKFGEVTDNSKDHGFKMYTMSPGYSGTSVAVECTKPEGTVLEFTMDCEGSTNTMSHSGNLKNTVQIPAGDIELLHHLSPEDGSLPWGWRASFSMVAKKK